MSVLDKVLSLRPGNVVARVGPGSRVPLLDPRELLGALESTPMALPCLPVLSKGALPGLLGAARAEDSVLGLSCPHPLADRGAPERFVRAVHAAAQEAEHTRPLFLQAGPLRVSSTDADVLDALQDGIFRVVDAGFALVSLDLSRLTSYEAVEAVNALVGPLKERELSLEVSPPQVSSGGLVDACATLLEGLAQWQVPLRFLRVSDAQLGEGELDVELLRRVVETAAGKGVAVAVADASTGPARGLSSYVAAGVRKVDRGGPFGPLALRAWPPEVREPVVARAQAAGMPAGELLSVMEEGLPALSPTARETLEALSFAEATEALGALGAHRSASVAMAFLAKPGGDLG
ncbi:hypothetical protein D7X30_39475 [Corallococcus sp. AB011P]|uniref:hypothetical protein n=1 Tax=unclassified Corallococcus TaxID=2685029 RepID=UPI000EA23D62|nr:MULTISPECIES: hypothetical protein [unclassified Corallococcus]RKG49251.1 hypothetical protein D7X30_39475 [Corallococcus sp. AB011P]RKH77208.1 hypothetical protein D7Y21_37625 [Corallococcus sp. AB045]